MAARDGADHVRYAPLQTPWVRDVLLPTYQLPGGGDNYSTAILWDHDRVYTHSSAIVRLLLLYCVVGWRCAVVGRIVWLIPLVVRNGGYRIFARHRGRIWTGVKRVTGIGDTDLGAYRDRIMGLDEVQEIPPSWGLGNTDDSDREKETTKKET